MFVLKSTHDRLKRHHSELDRSYRELASRFNSLTAEWNEVVDWINAKGGRAFMDGHRQFDDDDIKRLLSLCHPDKHDGKRLAVEMTQKLVAMRND